MNKIKFFTTVSFIALLVPQIGYSQIEIAGLGGLESIKKEETTLEIQNKTLSNNDSYLNFIVKLEKGRVTYLNNYKSKFNFFNLLGSNLIYLDKKNAPDYGLNMVLKDNIRITYNDFSGLILNNVNKEQCVSLSNAIGNHGFFSSFKINNNESYNNPDKANFCKNENSLYWK